MNIATLLFTYTRSYHTEQVIMALKNSTELPQKLFIFQDGLRKGEDDKEWKKTNDLIQSIDWCDKEIIVSKYNKGLAKSIVHGINYAFKNYDAVIVLEDDCVPAVDFIKFMQECFEKYKDYNKVYSISGYSYPIDIGQNDISDVYFCGRISSWGWGTWKDRWKKYKQDYTILQKMKFNKKKSVDLALWGNDLEAMLVDRVRGNNDSWAVFWALKVIEEGGICINPYRSLIRNIGLDGSGVHCGRSVFWDTLLDEKRHIKYLLPDTVEFTQEVKKACVPLFGSYTAINFEMQDKERILVYGVGNYFMKNEKQLNQDYYIEKFIDKYKKGYYAGKEIIQPSKMKNYGFEKVVIMLQDEKEAKSVADDFMYIYGIAKEKLKLGIQIYH